jgi:hypothetical protein
MTTWIQVLLSGIGAVAIAGIARFLWSGFRIRDQIGIDYMVCRAPDAMAELADGDVTQVPGAHQTLRPTPILADWSTLSRLVGEANRPCEHYGAEFDDPDSYLLAHPDAITADNDPRLPFFKAWRIPTTEEVRTSPVGKDPLVVLLMDAGLGGAHLAIAGLLPAGCDTPDHYLEVYLPAQVWSVLLRITNHGPNAVTLRKVVGRSFAAGFTGVRTWTDASRGGSKAAVAFPPLQLGPNQSVLVPVGTAIPALPPHPFPVEVEGYLKKSRYQTSGSVDGRRLANLLAIGSQFWPRSARVTVKGWRFHRKTRSLDLGRHTQVSRAWPIGSCPYLFVRSKNGSLAFVRELFVRNPGHVTTETYWPGSDAKAILVAELEPEISEIEWVRVGSSLQAVDVTLSAGEHLEINLPEEGSMVTIRGRYLPEDLSPLGSRSTANELVAAFLARDTARPPAIPTSPANSPAPATRHADRQPEHGEAAGRSRRRMRSRPKRYLR